MNLQPFVKPEPVEPRLPYEQETGSAAPPTEGVDDKSGILTVQTGGQVQRRPIASYTRYHSASEIAYTPDGVLREGLGMVESVNSKLEHLDLGSKLRKEVWLREGGTLKEQTVPRTMIAVCGATGSGKSSVLNAILDDNVVPTSGMRACTAVVTEISYHDSPSINGDVSFLSELEWKEELGILLDDLVDDDGKIKRSTDLRSDAGVAWAKVHAVYPSITHDMLAHMTADQIIARDPKIQQILGTTKRIVAPNSKIFATEIAKYIDSTDKRRGDKKDKKRDDKSKTNSNQKSLVDMFAKNSTPKAGERAKAPEAPQVEQPAFWPLIRQVAVRCNAKALSTGAILVDLPGTADANAARNSIAKEYMKKCQCIWILAPITRAVDDKTARDLLGDAFKLQLAMDGNYDASTITFIATKCDDLSCKEIISALDLQDDVELVEIQETLDDCKDKISQHKQDKVEAEKSCDDIEKQLKHVKALLKEYKEHLKALKKGEPFKPKLTAKAAPAKPSRGKKRKSAGNDKRSPKKRRKSPASDDDEDDGMDGSDFIVSDDDSSELSEIEDVDSDKASDASGNKSDSEEEDELDDDDDDEAQADEAVTEADLKKSIQDAKAAVSAGTDRLKEARQARRTATDELAAFKKTQATAQRDKNRFCALKRSEFSRDVLKGDFRVGLQQLDEEAALEKDPDSFDPSVALRDYEAIDLPVFTVSARDYVRLSGQIQGDGEPACFSQKEDTSIPSLQAWCHSLTLTSRERSARSFMTRLKTFANQVMTYVRGIGEVTEQDRQALRDVWESTPLEEEVPYGYGVAASPASSDSNPYEREYERILGLGAGLYSMPARPPAKTNASGELAGITPRLIKSFNPVVESCVTSLKSHFTNGLEDKMKLGAAAATASALDSTDRFMAEQHWQSLRAAFRRYGEYRRDFNEELTVPMTRQVATSWAKVFEVDLFEAFQADTTRTIEKLIKDVLASAPRGLTDRVEAQGDVCRQEVQNALQKTIEIVRATMQEEQKEISRCLAPEVRDSLREGYDRALEERGRGSVARQKNLFREYVDGHKGTMFAGGADVVLGRLQTAADKVGVALDDALKKLAQEVEVSMSVLWEGPARDDPLQRERVIAELTSVLDQLALWQAAEQASRAAPLAA